MSTPEARLATLGLVLPPVAAPVAAYVPAVRTGSYVYTAGQLPLAEGKLLATGKVGAFTRVEIEPNRFDGNFRISPLSARMSRRLLRTAPTPMLFPSHLGRNERRSTSITLGKPRSRRGLFPQPISCITRGPS